MDKSEAIIPSGTPKAIAEEGGQAAFRFWRRVAWVAGVFSALVAGAMFVGHLGVRAEDPLKSPQLTQLKETLRANPKDESIKREIRDLDLQLRQRYFRQLAHVRSGVYLLLGGTALFLLAGSRVSRYQKRPPLLLNRNTGGEQLMLVRSQARWSVAACGVLIGAGVFLLGRGPSVSFEESTGVTPPQAAQTTTPASDAAAAEELRRNWPRFLGPNGGGISCFTNAPASWDSKTGVNILWKTESPAISKGFGSPILWGKRIYYSSGDKERREVICLDVDTGQTVWEQAVGEVPGSPATPPDVPDSSGYAAATVATDGRRVYSFYGNGELAAFTLEGKLLWSKSFGGLKNPYGHATSLATWRERVLLQLDQGSSPGDARSALYLLEGSTGKEVWQKTRNMSASWATPIVIEVSGKAQIITLGTPRIHSYAPEDGSELWQLECLGDDVVPSPIFAGGRLLVASPSRELIALRPEGQGEMSVSNAVWRASDNVPDVTSPVSNGELVFTVNSFGTVTCYDLKDGAKLWEHEYEKEFQASPVISGDRLYLFARKGTALVLKAGRTFEELFQTQVEDLFHATPALGDGRIILRGEKFMWCIGSKEETKK